jgi:hypothetical protein
MSPSIENKTFKRNMANKGQIHERNEDPSMKFHETASNGRRVIPHYRTDRRTKLIVGFTLFIGHEGP